MPLALALALSSVAAPVQAQDRSNAQDGSVESRFTSIGPHDCTEVANGGEEEDWITHRCDGPEGRTVYLHFTDSVRLSLGFDDPANAVGMFSARRNDAWPMEWRGRVLNGRFIAHAAIARMFGPFEDASEVSRSHLVVISLRGPACMIGEASGARANEQARRLADNGSCRSSSE
jgi:hypothetical protein